jgi:glycosyltransferase involved in cell wall biosynthesis
LRRIAVLAPEPIRPRMAGMGIRALELARTLSSSGELNVRLIVPNDAAEAAEAAWPAPKSGLEIVSAPPERAGAAARGCDAGVVSGHAANWWFHQVPELPVACDLYDPFPVENLHYARALGPETARHDRETLALALARADTFLCASAEQRLFYAGALFSAGRIDANNFSEDPTLKSLLAVVPFGVPGEPSRGDRAAGRLAVGAAADPPLVLFGGIYDWYEPDLLLDAWPRIASAVPGAQLLFFANPNPETTPQRAFARAGARARKLDPEGRSILFSAWLPYAARADLYAASDLTVSIASPGLESDLAYRTRLLDAAWGGVPSVAVAGGPLAAELEAAGAARRVPRDAEALAVAVIDMLSEAPRRAAASAAARAFAVSRSWKSVAAPLVAWCRSPMIDPGRLPLPASRPVSLWNRVFARHSLS